MTFIELFHQMQVLLCKHPEIANQETLITGGNCQYPVRHIDRIVRHCETDSLIGEPYVELESDQ